MKKYIVPFSLIFIFLSCQNEFSTFWIKKNTKFDKNNSCYTSLIFFDKNRYFKFSGKISDFKDSLYFDLNDEGIIFKGEYKFEDDTIITTSRIFDSKIINSPFTEENELIVKKYYYHNNNIINDTIIYKPLNKKICIESMQYFHK